MTAPESNNAQPNNPLHGITLERMLREMVERFGWEGLARDVPARCFLVEPTMTSALKYLRKAHCRERRAAQRKSRRKKRS